MSEHSPQPKYWINVVSRDHVQRGEKGGFIQANHGKPQALNRMSPCDWMIFYSSKETYGGNKPLQEFTAICRLANDQPYQADVSEDFHPWRRNAEFFHVEETPIRPLIDQLEFIENKTSWGFRFRFGVFEISEVDFHLIATAMGLNGASL